MVYADQFSSVMPSWWSGVANIFSGVPWPVWASIAWSESSFNPASWNMGTAGHPEDSGGLFALNRAGGQGAGYSREWLKDPLNNATIAAPSIKAAYRQYGDDIGAVAIASGHPGSTATRDNALVQRITSTYAWMKGFSDPIEAVKKLLLGYSVPIIGGGSGGIGSIGSGIASGLLQGILGPIGSWWASFAAGGPDKWIDTLAPGLFIFTGTNLIGAGLLVGSLKSPVAQTAADAAMAAGPAPVKIAGGVVKAAGGNTSPLFTQVRQRNERRERARAAQGSPRPARKRVRGSAAVKRPRRTS